MEADPIALYISVLLLMNGSIKQDLNIATIVTKARADIFVWIPDQTVCISISHLMHASNRARLSRYILGKCRAATVAAIRAAAAAIKRMIM